MDVHADIGVQHESRLHQSPFRFCGLSFFRSPRSKSSGRFARISKTRSIGLCFSFRTSSSPRRKISSSLLFTRNSFGSLTAWLFPDLNTRAVAIFDSLPRIYAQYIRNLGSPNGAGFALCGEKTTIQ